jgi:c-di-GMP-binding flagellar brake protein YcgR
MRIQRNGKNMLLKCIRTHWIKTESNPYLFYGLDFSDGAVHDVADERQIRRLLQTGDFVEVKCNEDSDALLYHKEMRPMKRTKRKVRQHGNDHQG